MRNDLRRQHVHLDVGPLRHLAQQGKASSGAHPSWAMMMPLACSITAMVPSRARSRAYAESCKTSRRDLPSRI